MTTELGELTEAALADVCSLVTDGTHDTPRRVKLGYPLIKAKEIVGGRIDFETCDQISEAEHLKVVARSKPEFGDTLFAHIGASLGEAAFVNTTREFSIKNIALFKPNPAIVDPRYLHYLVISPAFQAHAKGTKTGSAQPFLGLSQLRSHRIRYHRDMAIQRRIAGILSTYDDLVETNQRRIKILEEMARSLYREWFVLFRFPGHDKVKMVPSPLGPIPQGWEVVPIDDVCELVTDGSHSSPKSVEQGLPMASSKDMHEWGLSLEACRHISRQDFDQLVRNGCKPKKNDVLITKDGANYLKHIFVVREEQELVLLSSIAILRPNERINPHLLTAILSAPENKDRLKNYVTGAAIPRIILSDFKQFKIVLPSQEVQDAWAKIGEPITQLCWRLIDQITNLRRTRDRLLPRLLSGQDSLEVGNG